MQKGLLPKSNSPFYLLVNNKICYNNKKEEHLDVWSRQSLLDNIIYASEARRSVMASFLRVE